MRKYVAFFMVLALLWGLMGCTQEPQETAQSPSYSVDDLLLFQAEALSRQVAMSAEAGYLTAIFAPAQIIPRAEIFLPAIQAEVLSGKLLREAPENFHTTVTQICATVSGTNDLALCSILTKTDLMHFPKKLTKPAAVYLRYSEECHFVVLFTPGENGTVSLWAYPLFAHTAEQVLAQHFADATNLTGDEIRAACKKAAKAKFEAKCPGKEVNAARYTAMAETIFSQVQPLSKQKIALYTNDEEVIALTMELSRALSQPAGDMAVYQFHSGTQTQISEILSQISYDQELEDHIRKMLYLAVPNQYCNAYGVNLLASNSVLHLCVDLTSPGIAAEKDEEPVLVLMGFGDSYSVLLAIYPNRYHTYQYSFGILPASFREVQEKLSATGMKPLE